MVDNGIEDDNFSSAKAICCPSIVELTIIEKENTIEMIALTVKTLDIQLLSLSALKFFANILLVIFSIFTI